MMSAIVLSLAVLITAASGAVFKPGAWYDSLRKPGWTPAGWVFPAVWTPLYIMIAVAGWLVWRDGPEFMFWIWVIQLMLNGAWSGLFFGAKAMRLAFVDLVMMYFLIIMFISAGWSANPVAAYLFIPYAIWVTLAGILNWQIMLMNPVDGAQADDR